MLYKYRKPVIVVIDDFFPVDNMRTYPYVQIGVAPDGVKEVWPMIIEKAYAKLGGGFPAIEGGLVADALQALTNGVPYIFEFSEESTKKMIETGELWTKMIQWSAKEFLMGAGSKSGSDKEVSDLGIVQGHAYSVLDFFELEGTKLVQLRNPWGDATEWKGAWGDHSAEWTEARKNAVYAFQESQGYERDIIGKGDGIFWMAYSDFLMNFDQLFLCRFFEGYEELTFNSEWSKARRTAGGCVNNNSVGQNPQLAVTVTGSGPVEVFCVLQAETDRPDICIGFTFYDLEGKGRVRDRRLP